MYFSYVKRIQVTSETENLNRAIINVLFLYITLNLYNKETCRFIMSKQVTLGMYNVNDMHLLWSVHSAV